VAALDQARVSGRTAPWHIRAGAALFLRNSAAAEYVRYRTEQ